MAQQTAVNFLVNYMLENFHLTDESLGIFEQAKQMFQEQIENAFSAGYDYPEKDCEQYYNETFKQCQT